jgi:hypothetical protein
MSTSSALSLTQHVHSSVQAIDKKKSGTGSVGSSSGKETAEAAGSTAGRTRRSSNACDDSAIAAESSTVQLNAELLPHFLVEVRALQHWCNCKLAGAVAELQQ